MKSKLLLFPSVLAILISCSKRVNDPFIPEEKNQLDSIYQAPKDPFLGIPEKTSVVHVQTSIVNYNQWQNFFVSPEKMTIVMWPSHDKTLVIKDVDKAIQGIAIDKESNTEVKTDNITIASGITFQDYYPGKYLIAVIMSDEKGQGKKAYSSKEITIKEYGKYYMHKIFSFDAKEREFEEWSPKIIEK